MTEGRRGALLLFFSSIRRTYYVYICIHMILVLFLNFPNFHWRAFWIEDGCPCKLGKGQVKVHREWKSLFVLSNFSHHCTTHDLQTMARCEVTWTSCLCLCLDSMLVCSMYGCTAHSITPSPADVCCQGMVCSLVLLLVFCIQLCQLSDCLSCTDNLETQ